MRREHILVVDDDQDITEVIRLYLENEGFQVTLVHDGRAGVRALQQEAFDLVLLDVLLPGLDGFEVCREIRKKTNIPVLFISCKSEETDKIFGLELGADDYVTKPFSPRELLARVKANLRRYTGAPAAQADVEPQVLRHGDLEIDLFSHQVKKRGSIVNLSSTEFKLLHLLTAYCGNTIGFDELYRSVWGSDTHNDTRTVTVHMSNLRKKLEDDPLAPRYIQTIRGIGYRLQFTP